MLLLALLSHRVENMKKIQFCFPTFPISCPFILHFLLLPFLLSFLPISLLFPFPYLFSSFPSPSHLPSLFPLPFFRTPPYFPSASIVPHLIFFLNSLILFPPLGGGGGATLYTPEKVLIGALVYLLHLFSIKFHSCCVATNGKYWCPIRTGYPGIIIKDPLVWLIWCPIGVVPGTSISPPT